MSQGTGGSRRRAVSAPFFLAASMLVLQSCSTLRNSSVDRKAFAMGFYQCQPTSITRPGGENPDATVARCQRESVLVKEDSVEWERHYFGTADCTGTVMGSTRWSGKLTGFEDAGILRVVLAREQVLIRRHPHWYNDARGVNCDLRSVPLDTPISIADGSLCRGFYTSIDEELPLRILPGAPGQAPTLQGRWNGKSQICSR